MNLQDKRELLNYKKGELKSKQADISTYKEKLKSLTIEDDTYNDLQEKVTTLLNDITLLNEDITSLSSDITTEEKSLNDLSNEYNKTKSLKPSGKNDYLKSKQAVIDFANILEKGMNGVDTRKAWEDSLKAKGVTNPDLLLPEAIVTEINNALEQSGFIYKTFNDTGLTVFKVMHDTQSDGTERAHGHKKGTTKKEENITLTKKEIRAQYIYKYLTLDKEIIREQQDTGALINYVMKELPQKVIMEIERAAIVGDGRSSGDEDKITKFEAITEADDYYVTKTEATTNFYEDIILNLKGKIKAQGKKYLVMSTDSLSELQLAKDGAGHYIFPAGLDIAKTLGVDTIFTPTWMDSVKTTVKAIMYVGNAYKMVGDKDLSSYENFLLSQNKNEYLMEIYKGGALAEYKSAAVLTAMQA